MNKWSMDGGVIEKWDGGGGRTLCSKGMRHYSTHPMGRTDAYRHINRANRYKPRMHGQHTEAPVQKRKK